MSVLACCWVAVGLPLSTPAFAQADPGGPAVVAPAAVGVLKVTANVPGATTWLDGVIVGTTPLTKIVAAGSHSIRVAADNHDPFVRKLDVQPDRTTEVNASLLPGKGTIEFTGPKGTQLQFDGTSYVLPTRISAPPGGRHRYLASAPGFETAEGTIDFVQGKNVLVEVVLETSDGVVAVTSTPTGARVLLDGRDAGLAPLKLKGVSLGKHGVALVLDGYAVVYKSIDTTAGGRAEVSAALDRSGAVVTIDTPSANSRAFVEHTEVGSGESVRLPMVERGKVLVRVVTGDKVAEGVVTVPSSGSLALRVAGSKVVEKKPITQSWGFWAAVGGVAAGAAAGGIAAAVVTAPEPPPTGDTVVTLP
jgi:hypothetical protein